MLEIPLTLHVVFYENPAHDGVYDARRTMASSDQVPTNSGFPAKTDGAVVIAELDLNGKTAIVTGGYSGIGLETTRALAAKGVTVIVPVRSPEKAAQSLGGIEGAFTGRSP